MIHTLIKDKRLWLWTIGIAAILGSAVGGAIGLRVWQIHRQVAFYQHDPALFEPFRSQTIRLGDRFGDTIATDAITCRTCHRHPGWFGQLPPLRDHVVEKFCAQCHGDDAQDLHDRFHSIAADRETELRNR
jgi:hypothetical protein